LLVPFLIGYIDVKELVSLKTDLPFLQVVVYHRKIFFGEFALILLNYLFLNNIFYIFYHFHKGMDHFFQLTKYFLLHNKTIICQNINIIYSFSIITNSNDGFSPKHKMCILCG